MGPVSHVFPECGTHRSATKFNKCVTYACNAVRMSCSLESSMRCHGVSRRRNYKLRAITKLDTTVCPEKGRKTTVRFQRATALNKRLSAHQSATSAKQDFNRFSILCDSQKHTTCLDVHHSACLKHFTFHHIQNTVCSTAVHMSSSCSTIEFHAFSLAEECLGESVTTISPSTLQGPGLSECLEVLLPMECIPEISSCLVPAPNRGFLR